MVLFYQDKRENLYLTVVFSGKLSGKSTDQGVFFLFSLYFILPSENQRQLPLFPSLRRSLVLGRHGWDLITEQFRKLSCTNLIIARGIEQ